MSDLVGFTTLSLLIILFCAVLVLVFPVCAFWLPQKLRTRKYGFWTAMLGVLLCIIVLIKAPSDAERLEKAETPEERAKIQARIEIIEADKKSSMEAYRAKKAEEARIEAAKYKPYEDAIRKKVKKSSKYGNYTIKFDNSSRRFDATLTYERGPMTRKEAEAISTVVVKAMLDYFASQKINPMSEMYSVNGTVFTPYTGASGAEMINVYGSAMYDYNDDRIHWHRQD